MLKYIGIKGLEIIFQLLDIAAVLVHQCLGLVLVLQPQGLNLVSVPICNVFLTSVVSVRGLLN